jgi:hypothetical protein
LLCGPTLSATKQRNLDANLLKHANSKTITNIKPLDHSPLLIRQKSSVSQDPIDIKDEQIDTF